MYDIYHSDGCEAEIIEGYTWDETDLGDYASSECPCSEYLDTLAGRAFRYCGGDYRNGAQWSQEIDASACVALTSTTSRLCQAAAVNIRLKNYQHRFYKFLQLFM